MKMQDEKVSGIKLAYIGGGSRGWAWGFMKDLARDSQMEGVVYLYDIDRPAACLLYTSKSLPIRRLPDKRCCHPIVYAKGRWYPAGASGRRSVCAAFPPQLAARWRRGLQFPEIPAQKALSLIHIYLVNTKFVPSDNTDFANISGDLTAKMQELFHGYLVGNTDYEGYLAAFETYAAEIGLDEAVAG